ncbi:MAG: hypothetical protein WAK48_08000 [Candidatus Acidiferrum sp.]|jgi:hypothetical protein
MVTRTAKQPDRRALEVYPTTSEIQEAFSELLAVIERVRKYDAPGDTALPLLNVEILSSLGELKIHAERIEETYHRMHSQRTGLRVLTGGNTISSSNLLEQVKVGSKLHVWMVGVVESLDDNSMLMRFDMPRLSRNV